MCSYLNEYQIFIAPHRLKCRALGRPVVMLPVILFTDDTSGNHSKQWNKFDSWNLRIVGLPDNSSTINSCCLNICCSNKCDMLDMANPLVDDLNGLELDGVVLKSMMHFFVRTYC